MATYEYKCNKCDSIFEVKRSIKEENKNVICDQCGNENVSKIFSSFIFSKSGVKSTKTTCNTCSTKTCSTCH